MELLYAIVASAFAGIWFLAFTRPDRFRFLAKRTIEPAIGGSFLGLAIAAGIFWGSRTETPDLALRAVLYGSAITAVYAIGLVAIDWIKGHDSDPKR